MVGGDFDSIKNVVKLEIEMLGATTGRQIKSQMDNKTDIEPIQYHQKQ